MSKSKDPAEEAALQMIDRYGDDALHEIELRILELQYHDRPDELALWRSIRDRVALMMSKPGTGSRH